MKKLRRLLFTLWLGVVPEMWGAEAPEGWRTLDLTVDGVSRSALVHVPPGAGERASPLVFIFHGHGGNMRQVARSFGFDRRWPEAISVCPQGLPTPGMITDPTGQRAGWQSAPGGQGDRDLRFFDALLARLKADYRVDDARVYGTGHSNGAGFTFLLWWTRPTVFAAVAPCSGAAVYVGRLTPKPAMLLGGRNDRLVRFEWQERAMEMVKRVNGCEGAGVPWGGGAGTLYPSKTGTPLVTYVYDGGHMMDAAEPDLIVRFFQERPAVKPGS